MSQGVRSREVAEIAAAPLGWPHPGQNRALGANGAPHPVQVVPSRGEPHWEQNFPDPGVPQEGQGVAGSLTEGTVSKNEDGIGAQ